MYCNCVQGGGWRRGDRRWRHSLYSNVGWTLAEQGFVTAVVSYRLSDLALSTLVLYTAVAGAILSGILTTRLATWLAFVVGCGVAAAALAVRLLFFRGEVVKHPSHVEDVAAAVAWMGTNAPRFGGNPSNMVLMGHSAGAHLGLLAVCDPAYLRRARFPASAGARIVACVGVSGVYSGAMLYGSCIGRLIYFLPAFGHRARADDAFPLEQLRAAGSAPEAFPPAFLLVNAATDLGLDKHTDVMQQRLEHAGASTERHGELVDGVAVWVLKEACMCSPPSCSPPCLCCGALWCRGPQPPVIAGTNHASIVMSMQPRYKHTKDNRVPPADGWRDPGHLTRSPSKLTRIVVDFIRRAVASPAAADPPSAPLPVNTT